MYDETDAEAGVFHFDEIADLLLEQGLQSSPSELHGCLSGLLAAGAGGEPEAGLDGLSQALDLVVYGELAAQLMRLYTGTSEAMEDEEFDFYPMVPDDDTDLVERTASLALWARGFLAGFAHVTAVTGRAGESLSSDSSEILKDFAAMTLAEVDAELDEDDSEASYTELLEYLRFGTLNVYMDCAVIASDERVAGSPEQPLH